MLVIGLIALVLSFGCGAAPCAAAGSVLLPDADVRDALLTDDGTLWAACAATGVVATPMTTTTGPWQTFTPLNSHLSNPHPVRLAWHESTLWTALYNDGLWRHHDGDWTGPFPNAGTAEMHCSDLIEWRTSLWFTLGDRLGLVGAAGAVETVHPPLPPGRGAVVTCLAVQGPTLLVGTNVHQILQFDGSTWSILDFKHRIRGKRIRAIVTMHGRLWFGTFGGLYEYVAPELRSVEPAGLTPPLVTSLAVTQGTLWVGTWGSGVFRRTGERWYHGDGTRSTAGLFVNRLRCTTHRVLACTTTGIHVLDPTREPEPRSSTALAVSPFGAAAAP